MATTSGGTGVSDITITTTSPVFQRPTDPLEIAQLRLEGKCVECKQMLPDHDHQCSESPQTLVFNTGVGIANFGTSYISVGDKKEKWTVNTFGITAHVADGKQPNWFHRHMQRVFLGINWSQKK
jgi:hypothetical protein